MTGRQRTIPCVIAAIVIFVRQSPVVAQSTCDCQCRQSVSRLPVPALNKLSILRSGQTRDPFTGEWLSVGSELRWSPRNVASNETNSQAATPLEKSPLSSTDTLEGNVDSSVGAAFGGGFSSGISGNSASSSTDGGVPGGIVGGNSNWTPGGTGSGSIVGGSGGSIRGGSESLSSSAAANRSSASTQGNNTFRFADARPPEYSVPQPKSEIPQMGGNPIVRVELQSEGVGDAPIVPEPGSGLLMAIAMTVSGAWFIRRRQKREQTAESINGSAECCGAAKVLNC